MTHPHWQSATVLANGLNFHYNRTGAQSAGKPPLVMAHGFSDNGLCWTPVAQALAADYDIIMVDARHHGLSDSPDRPFGQRDQIDDLAAFIAALKLEQPIIHGHSMGAITALGLAACYPSVPRALLLEDPPPAWVYDAPPPANDQWQAQTRLWLTGLKAKTRDQILATIHAESPGWSQAERDPWADSKMQVNLRALDCNNGSGIDWPGLLANVTCPVLLITADTSLKSIVSPEQATALQALVPQTQIAHILGAGHSIRRDQFTAYMAAVGTFLASLTPKQ